MIVTLLSEGLRVQKRVFLAWGNYLCEWEGIVYSLPLSCEKSRCPDWPWVWELDRWVPWGDQESVRGRDIASFVQMGLEERRDNLHRVIYLRLNLDGSGVSISLWKEYWPGAGRSLGGPSACIHLCRLTCSMDKRRVGSLTSIFRTRDSQSADMK